MPRMIEMYTRAMPETTGFRESRMSATPRASTSPIAKEARASGIVPLTAPQTIGQKESRKSCSRRP